MSHFDLCVHCTFCVNKKTELKMWQHYRICMKILNELKLGNEQKQTLLLNLFIWFVIVISRQKCGCCGCHRYHCRSRCCCQCRCHRRHSFIVNDFKFKTFYAAFIHLTSNEIENWLKMSKLKAWKLLISNGTHAANSISITDWQHLLCACVQVDLCLDVNVDVYFLFVNGAKLLYQLHLIICMSSFQIQWNNVERNYSIWNFVDSIGSIEIKQQQQTKSTREENFIFDWIWNPFG